LPDINIIGDYIITERSISRLTDTKPRVRIVLKNQNYFTKYGTIYNKYDKNIRRLSVNEKAVILQTEASYNETLSLDETWEQAPWVFYPVTAASGDFVDPVVLIYPMEALA
jgi:hypothetical protein